MEIAADQPVNQKLNGFRLGWLESLITCQSSGRKLRLLIDEEGLNIQRKYRLEEVNKIRTIAETREAYKKLGNDPNRYRPSADSLMRRIVKGMGIYSINNVVDMLNLISIQSGFSIGGYDSSAISGNIELGIGKSGEPYNGIGRGDLNITNLPILRDDISAFGTPTSDSERTMIKDATHNILFVFFDFGCNSSLDEYLTKSTELLSVHCSAQKSRIGIHAF